MGEVDADERGWAGLSEPEPHGLIAWEPMRWASKPFLAWPCDQISGRVASIGAESAPSASAARLHLIFLRRTSLHVGMLLALLTLSHANMNANVRNATLLFFRGRKASAKIKKG